MYKTVDIYRDDHKIHYALDERWSENYYTVKAHWHTSLHNALRKGGSRICNTVWFLEESPKGLFCVMKYANDPLG